MTKVYRVKTESGTLIEGVLTNFELQNFMIDNPERCSCCGNKKGWERIRCLKKIWSDEDS